MNSRRSHINWTKRHAELRNGIDETRWAALGGKLPFALFQSKRPDPPSPATTRELRRRIAQHFEDAADRDLPAAELLTIRRSVEATAEEQLQLVDSHHDEVLQTLDLYMLTGPGGLGLLDQLALLAQKDHKALRKLHTYADRLANEVYALALAGNARAAEHFVKLALKLTEQVHHGHLLAPKIFGPIARTVPAWPICYHPNPAKQYPKTATLRELHIGGRLEFADSHTPRFSLSNDCDKLLCSLYQHIAYFRDIFAKFGDSPEKTTGLPTWIARALKLPPLRLSSCDSWSAVVLDVLYFYREEPLDDERIRKLANPKRRTTQGSTPQWKLRKSLHNTLLSRLKTLAEPR